MFKKCAVFTDLHLGGKGNSLVHNNDCEDFIDWFIDQSVKNNAETGIFLGDWHHNRNNLNINTLSTSVRCLEKLGKAFEKFYFIPGNHDQFYRNSRNIHSVEWGNHIDGIIIINEQQTFGDTTLVPWLVGDEWLTMKNLNSKYVFGHFELPDFYMNAMVKMPNHGGLNEAHFKSQSYVFSGHYHMRQVSNPVIYIGNAFPHNFSDAWDDNRGMMLLEHGGSPEFINWDNAPSYRTCKITDLIDNPTSIVKDKCYIRATMDANLTFEEAATIKDELIAKYGIRELSIIPARDEELDGGNDEETSFTTVDEVVFKQIDEIESDVYSKDMLAEIYRSI